MTTTQTIDPTAWRLLERPKLSRIHSDAWDDIDAEMRPWEGNSPAELERELQPRPLRLTATRHR